MLKQITVGLILIEFSLVYSTFFSKSSPFDEIKHLEYSIIVQDNLMKRLEVRNDILADTIVRLRDDPTSIEEHARFELGLIKNGELFYQLVDTIH